MHLKAIRTLWLFPALLALASCLPFGQQEVPARIPLKNETVVVLPFKMPNSSYFESAVGRRFSRDIAQWIRIGCPKTTVADAAMLPKSLVEDGVKAFKAEDIMEDNTIVLLGKRLEVDIVVVGEIHELRSKDPKALGVMHGTMRVSWRVADVRLGKVIWEAERKEFSYPPDLMEVEPVPAIDEKDEEQVTRMTMQEAARSIAVVFGGRDRLFADQSR